MTSCAPCAAPAYKNLDSLMPDGCQPAACHDGAGRDLSIWGSVGGFVILIIIIALLIWWAKPKWVLCGDDKCKVNWASLLSISAILAVILLLIFGALLSCRR